MELLKLKPDVYIFLHHFLWILWVPTLFTVLYFCDFFEGNCIFLALVIVFVVVFAVYRAVDVYLKDLELSEEYITETFRGQIIFYLPWKDVNYALVTSTNRWFLPNNHTLLLYYGDPENPRTYTYELAELSDNDRERAIARLKLHLQNFDEINI